MSTTDEQLRKDFTKKEKINFIFLSVISIAGIIDGLFIRLLDVGSEKIVLSGGLALSFYSVYLMAKSKELRIKGKKFSSHTPLTPKRYKWGKRGIFIGFLFQLFGIWLYLFKGMLAIANTPLIINLPETVETSLIDKILNDPSLIIASLALIATICIAIASWRSVITTRNTSQAQLYLKLFEEYASARMEDALRELRNLQESPRWKEFVTDYPEGGPEFREKLGDLYSGRLTTDRRYVKYYFISALKLCKLKFISKDLFKKLAGVAGVDLLYDVVRRLEVNPRARKHIEEIERMCGRYDEESEKE